MFTELSAIDDKLSIVRAQKYAKVKAEPDELPENGEHPMPDEIDAEALVRTPAATAADKQKKPAAKKPKAPKTDA